MPVTSPRPKADAAARRSTSFNVRASQYARDLIERAAEVSGKTITDFLLDSATERAVEVLLDQRLFTLDPERHDAFMRALDAAPAPNEKLKALMRKAPVWES